MAISEAQKKANQKWDSANLDRLSLAMPKGAKEAVKAFAAAHGESVNGFINRAINETMTGAQNIAPDGDKNAGAILTPAALKTAQEAAQRAGETVPEFVSRAVETQAQRDKVMQAMRPREKAPDKSET